MTRRKAQVHIRKGLAVSAIAKRCRKCIRRVTYKTGDRFRLVDLSNGSLAIYLQRDIKDTVDGLYITLSSTRWYFENGNTEAYILNCMWRMVTDFESHEAREHFKVDGVKVFDPHKVLWPEGSPDP